MSNCFTVKRTVSLTSWQIEELQPFINAILDKEINPNGDMAIIAQVWVHPDGFHTLEVIMVDSIGAKEVQATGTNNCRRHKP